MISMDYADQITELSMKLHEIKAVAEVFDDKFISPKHESAVLTVTHEHDKYVHLFAVLFDLIHDAYTAADKLNGDVWNDEREVSGGV